MPTAVPPGERCDALVVEDDKVQCEEMAKFLARAGITVAMAFNASSAINQAGHVRPRVALLDCNLPDMHGIELAARLRSALPDTAILMMSGRIDGLSEKVIRTLGITVFVNKPVPLAALRQAVLKLVRSDFAPSGQRTGWLSTGLGGTR